MGPFRRRLIVRNWISFRIGRFPAGSSAWITTLRAAWGMPAGRFMKRCIPARGSFTHSSAIMTPFGTVFSCFLLSSQSFVPRFSRKRRWTAPGRRSLTVFWRISRNRLPKVKISQEPKKHENKKESTFYVCSCPVG